MFALNGNRCHRHVKEGRTQVIVGIERTLVVAMHLISLGAAAEPEVSASVEHEMIDIEVGPLEGEAEIGLMQQLMPGYAIVKHAHRRANQQDVHIGNMEKRQHIGLPQSFITRQHRVGILPVAFTYIIYFKAFVMQSQPEMRVDDDGLFDGMFKLVECQHTSARDRTVAIGSLLRDDPKVVLRVEEHLVVGIVREGDIRQKGHKSIRQRIVAQHLSCEQQENLTATVLGNTLWQKRAVGNGHMREGIHFVVECHAILGHDPKPALLVAMQIAHLIVGQAVGLVIAEVLMHLIAIQAVQAAIGANPYISVLVLYDGLNALVRKLGRYLHTGSIGLDRSFRRGLTGPKQHEE